MNENVMEFLLEAECKEKGLEALLDKHWLIRKDELAGVSFLFVTSPIYDFLTHKLNETVAFPDKPGFDIEELIIYSLVRRPTVQGIKYSYRFSIEFSRKREMIWCAEVFIDYKEGQKIHHIELEELEEIQEIINCAMKDKLFVPRTEKEIEELLVFERGAQS